MDDIGNGSQNHSAMHV